MAANDVTIRVGSTDNTSSDFDRLKERLDKLKAERAKVSVDADDKEAVAKLTQIDVKIASVNRRLARPKITVEGAARAEADIAAVDLAMSRLGGNSEKAAEGAALMVTPMQGVIAAGVVLSPVLVTVATGLAGFGAAAYKTLSPIEQAAQATGGLRRNLGMLDSGQQGVARSLLGLEGQFGKFSAALEPEALTAFSTGIHIASGLLSDIGPVAKATGGAIDGLLSRVDAEFRSGTWQSFFAFMAKNAGPDIQLLGTAFINLMDALPGLVTNLQPVATQLLQVVAGGAKLIDIGTKIQTVVDSTGRSAQSSGGFLGGLAKSAGDATQQTVPAFGAVVKLGQAFGILSGSSSKAKDATGQAASAITKVSQSAQQAAQAVQQLDTDWNNLVGNFATRDQVFANAEQSFGQLVQTIRHSGGSSATARDAFDSYVQSIGSGITSLRGAGASSGTINQYLSQQIARLKTLGPLTAAQQQQLAGLIKYQDDAATSIANMDKQQQAAARTAESQLVPQLKAMGLAGKTARADANDLTAAIINTGVKSAATAGARAQLISDLEHAGLTASQAAAYVDSLEGRLARLKSPPPVNVVINHEDTFSSFRVGTTGRVGRAAGGLITGGTPGRDSVPIMAMPGEVVVPAPMVAAGAVDHLRGRLPGFAGGGMVGGSRGGAHGAVAASQQVVIIRFEASQSDFAQLMQKTTRALGGDPAMFQKKVAYA